MPMCFYVILPQYLGIRHFSYGDIHKLISWGAIHIFWSLIFLRCWVEGISDARRDLLWNGYGKKYNLGKKGESDQLIRDENRYTSGL